jgi:hypothetical protein
VPFRGYDENAQSLLIESMIASEQGCVLVQIVQALPRRLVAKLDLD